MHNSTLDAVIVGKVIANIRKQNGMSQEVLSGLAVIARSHLSAIECGDRKPTLETLYRICNALNVKMSVVVKCIEDELENNK